jgi:hypothetical protein
LLTRRARYELDRAPPSPERALPAIGALLLRLAMIRWTVERTRGPVDERFVTAAQLLAKHVETTEPIAQLERGLFVAAPERALFASLMLAKLLSARAGDLRPVP